MQLPSRALLSLIRAYQYVLAPALPALFGSSCGCRFFPSCSHYATEAIRTHGALIGTALAAVRLLKCTPLHPGGFDPVPTRRCVRVPKAAASSASHAPSLCNG
jgi:putative membrane protein insertion efficiency factor